MHLDLAIFFGITITVSDWWHLLASPQALLVTTVAGVANGMEIALLFLSFGKGSRLDFIV